MAAKLLSGEKRKELFGWRVTYETTIIRSGSELPFKVATTLLIFVAAVSLPPAG